MDFQSYRELGLRTFPLEGKKPAKGIRQWRDVGLNERWEVEYPNAGIAMLNDRITVIDVDDKRYVDEARMIFGATPVEVETRKGFHLWYRANGEKRRIRPDPMLPIDVLGVGGYTVVPKSEGYRFVRGGLADVADLPPILTDARALLERPAITQNGPVEPRELEVNTQEWSQMRDGSGRNNALFAKARELAVRADSKADFYAYVAAANALFSEPLPDHEVESVTASVWSYREEGRLFCSTRPGYGVTHEVYDTLRGNPDAVALLCELLRQHNWRKGEDKEFALSNVLAPRIGLSRHRFVQALKTLEATGQLVVTNSGGRGEGDVRKVRLLT